MSTPKIVKILSLQKRKSLQQDKCGSLNQDKSTIETVIMTQNNTISSSESILVGQIKKLSKDNDRMWKLLTQNTQNHAECSKIQKKLKLNLQCVQKQASMIKQMYDVQKVNHSHSKIFYQKREMQWQSIVSELKKVIQDYESTSQLDMCRASQIFNQSTQLRTPKATNKNQKLKIKEPQSEYYNHQLYGRQAQPEKVGKTKNQQQYQSKIQNLNHQSQESQIKQSQIQYRDSEVRQSILSIRSKKHRQKWFRTPNSREVSSSSKKLFQNLYKKQMSNMVQNKMFCNPQIRDDFLNSEDLLDYAIRRTYMKFRQEGERAFHIMNNQHMQKLKIANSSTKERLHKTVRKIFILNNQKQLEDIIQYIQDKVHRKYKLVKGQYIFKFLEDKFLQCQQLIETSNSALDRLDKQASNVINGASMNSRFKIFEQKKRQIRSLQKFQASNNSRRQQSLRQQSRRQQTPIDTLRNFDKQSSISSKSSNLLLNIDSNIKADKNMIYYHQNNHLNKIIQSEEQLAKKNKQRERDNSRKNIYTQKNISNKRQFLLQPERYNTDKKIQNSRESSNVQNLSSLIGGTNLCNQYEIAYRSTQKDIKSTGNKTSDTTIKS